jgi:mRNA interferase RelE/StbE
MPKTNLSKKAEKALRALPKKHGNQIARKLLRLADGAVEGKPLKGGAKHYMSLASGEYRIVYFEDGDVLKVVLIDKRNDERVYKQVSRKR